MGLYVLKVILISCIPQGPRNHRPSFQFLPIKPINKVSKQDVEVQSISITFLQLASNQSPNIFCQGALPQNMDCRFIMLATNGAYQINLDFTTEKISFSWKNIRKSSPYKISNLWWSIQHPKLCPQFAILASQGMFTTRRLGHFNCKMICRFDSEILHLVSIQHSLSRPPELPNLILMTASLMEVVNTEWRRALSHQQVLELKRLLTFRD